MLRASQERDWIAVPVRRNADGEEDEAVEHTKGETRDRCLGEPTHRAHDRRAPCWHLFVCYANAAR